ncbi:TetR/AcrR family transcriptional regulator [Brachybacterium squillarum]|uniref:TetR/AcrR family transcriptional regulator n=1 Tax=Brachybacterium squillarum TaxID=661979 RepID=UPI000262977E|nr:TetR/AcrR family transcriptional regulator [Brachybacterium squillarum]
MQEPRSRRGGASKVPLTRRLIVDTALEFITDRGFDALTMRSLAQVLDTGPSALYVYFKNKQHLVDALVDAALTDVEIPDSEDDMPWTVQLEPIAMESIHSLARHPGLGTGMVGRVPSAHALLRISEAYLRILITSGHDVNTALLAVDVLNSVVITEANEISTFEMTGGKEHLDEAENVLAELDPDAFPHLSRLSHAAMQSTPSDRARWAVRTFISGLAANSTTPSAPAEN